MTNEAKQQVKSGETNSEKPLRATHGSPSRPLKIANAEIPAYVLSNEMRILSGRGLRIADECEILQRGFAKVGIIALVDEVTGYQDDRDSLALQNFSGCVFTALYRNLG
jgi:hypothetical protein